MPHSLRYKQARIATIVGALVNTLLAAVKILCGLIGNSYALVADGLHSLSDLLSDALVLWAAKVGSQDADKDHPYGHARIETAATFGLALLLLTVGVLIAWDAVMHAWRINSTPHSYTLWVALFSVIANEIVYQYTIRISRAINSQLLAANAWHSRSDAASSLIVLIGIAGSLLGWPLLEAFAAIVIAGFIMKMAWDLGWPSIKELVDTSIDEKTVAEIKRVIVTVPGVKALHQLRTRYMGESAYVDVHILVDPHISVSEGHYIGEQARMALLKQIKKVTDVTVHVDPEDDEQYPLSPNLPSRVEIETWFENAWRDLPSFEHIEHYGIHYLSNKLQVDVFLPLNLIDSSNQYQKLVKQYRKPFTDHELIAEIRLIFVPS